MPIESSISSSKEMEEEKTNRLFPPQNQVPAYLQSKEKPGKPLKRRFTGQNLLNRDQSDVPQNSTGHDYGFLVNKQLVF